jgi:helix-turn-helix protein
MLSKQEVKAVLQNRDLEPAERSRKGRELKEPFTPISPIFNGVERPVTTAQLAAHLQVCERTIANYRAARTIPFWRINKRRIMYRISDVERCLSLKNT